MKNDFNNRDRNQGSFNRPVRKFNTSGGSDYPKKEYNRSLGNNENKQYFKKKTSDNPEITEEDTNIDNLQNPEPPEKHQRTRILRSTYSKNSENEERLNRNNENKEDSSENTEEFDNRSYNNRGGYNNNRGGYNNNREGGYENRSGYNNNREGGYENRGGYNNNREGGYENRSGYNNNRGGGYENRGGYNNNREGGYENRSGYNNNRGGGYENRSGYNNNREGGYENRSGYNNNREGGYENRSGYNNNREGGYENRGGYNNNRGGGYENRGGYNNNRGGGYENRSGYNNNRGGGYENRSGYNNNREGGYENRGGYNNNRGGGYENRNGYNNSRGGGYENRNNPQNRKQVRNAPIKKTPVNYGFEEEFIPEITLNEATEMRLNKFIAQCGVCGRRDADDLIKDGKVQVNGITVTQMGVKIHPNEDVISYNGEILSRQKKIYILYNKPKSTPSYTDDESGKKTVLDTIEEATKEKVYPVGRLDKDTTGLIILTNDGDLTEKLTHPTNEIRKYYHVILSRRVAEEDMQQLLDGLELEDGLAKVDSIQYVEGRGREEVLVEIHISRNRIVRRMFESLGYKVKMLDRVKIAFLTKKGIPRGTWRYLDEKEMAYLKMLPSHQGESLSINQYDTIDADDNAEAEA